MIAYFLGGCAIYGIVLFVLVMLRPKSALHTKKLTDCGRREKITIGVVLVILILHTADGAGTGLERGRPWRDESV